MIKQLRAAICLMDLEKRMSGACEIAAEDLSEQERDFLIYQIRRLAS